MKRKLSIKFVIISLIFGSVNFTNSAFAQDRDAIAAALYGRFNNDNPYDGTDLTLRDFDKEPLIVKNGYNGPVLVDSQGGTNLRIRNDLLYTVVDPRGKIFNLPGIDVVKGGVMVLTIAGLPVTVKPTFGTGARLNTNQLNPHDGNVSSTGGGK